MDKTTLKQAISSTSLSDLDLIISFKYPWGTTYPEPSPETPEDTTDFEDDLRTAIAPSQSPHGPLPFEEPPVQQSSQQDMTIENLHFATDQQAPYYTASSIGGFYPDVFDFNYQAAVEDVFMHNDRTFPFEANW